MRGQHPQSRQETVCAFAHETDPADHRPGHGPDHRDQQDAAIESAVPGNLRNTLFEDDFSVTSNTTAIASDSSTVVGSRRRREVVAR